MKRVGSDEGGGDFGGWGWKGGGGLRGQERDGLE
jgi:hypothetical protein